MLVAVASKAHARLAVVRQVAGSVTAAFVAARLFQHGRVLRREWDFHVTAFPGPAVRTEAFALRAHPVLARIVARRFVARIPKISWDTQALAVHTHAIVGARFWARFFGGTVFAGETWDTKALAIFARTFPTATVRATQRLVTRVPDKSWVAKAFPQQARALARTSFRAPGDVEDNVQATGTTVAGAAIAFTCDTLSTAVAHTSFPWAFLHMFTPWSMPPWLAQALAKRRPVLVPQTEGAHAM